MADRFLLKQFAGQADNNGIFGSAQQGEGQVVSDLKQVQSLNAFENGWDSATVTGDYLPCLEEFQGVTALLYKAVKELYSEGVPQWLSTETYYQDSIVMYNHKLYRNITGTYNTNNPALDTTNWRNLADDFTDKLVDLVSAQTISGAKTFTSVVDIATSTDTSEDSTDAVNVKYLHDNGYLTSGDVVDITSTQTITGNKTFSGETKAVTVAQGDDSTNVATTAFVKGNIQLVTSLPTTQVTGVLYCIPES